MIVAIIGTRTPTPEQRNGATRLAQELSELGHTIRTGGALGIDNAAIIGTVSFNLLEVCLPWANYNSLYVPLICKRTVYDPAKHQDWFQSVYKYHPRPGALSRRAIYLHARNYGIIMGPPKVDLYLAYPKDKDQLGGTGQGIRIAQANKIPGISIYGASPTVEHVLEYVRISTNAPVA